MVCDNINLLGNSEEELQQLTRRLEETADECGMEISSDKEQNSHQHHQAKTIHQHTDERTNARRNGSVQILRSTQTKDGKYVKEVKIRLAQAH